MDALANSGGFIVAVYLILQPFAAVISGLSYELEVMSLLFVGKETRPIENGSDIMFGKKYSEVRLSMLQFVRLFIDLYNPMTKLMGGRNNKKAPVIETELF